MGANRAPPINQMSHGSLKIGKRAKQRSAYAKHANTGLNALSTRSTSTSSGFGEEQQKHKGKP